MSNFTPVRHLAAIMRNCLIAANAINDPNLSEPARWDIVQQNAKTIQDLGKWVERDAGLSLSHSLREMNDYTALPSLGEVAQIFAMAGAGVQAHDMGAALMTETPEQTEAPAQEPQGESALETLAAPEVELPEGGEPSQGV